jgi:Ferritin-like domain/TAT (twin-arginine translocation) pathway signal sequence
VNDLEMNNDPVVSTSVNRRRFLGGAGAIGAALVLAACGDDSSTTDSSTASGTTAATATTAATGASTTAAASGASAAGDAKIAALAASLEVLAVGTYKAALDAAGAGKLGAVPPAVATFVTTARDHHQKHLDAWNAAIVKAGGKAVDQPNATLKPTVDATFAKVTDVIGAAKLALQLEQIAAATYLSAIPKLLDKDAIQLAGSIQIIDAQHASILLFVLGEYPVPDVFAKTDMAATA